MDTNNLIMCVNNKHFIIEENDNVYSIKECEKDKIVYMIFITQKTQPKYLPPLEITKSFFNQIKQSYYNQQKRLIQQKLIH